MNPSTEAPALASQEFAEGVSRTPQGDDDVRGPVISGLSAAPPLYRRRADDYCAKDDSVAVEADAALGRLLSQITKDDPYLRYAALTAAISACLYRYTRSSPVAIGSPAVKPESESSPSGNLVMVVSDIEPEMTFRGLLLNVRESVLETRKRSAPLSFFLDEAARKGIYNRCLFFDVALVVAGLHPDMPEAKHDIALTFSDAAGRPALRAAFSAKLYDPETIRLFCGHILTILQSGLENTGESIARLALLTPPEIQTLSIDWNAATATEYPRNRCVHQLFEEHAARSPLKTALVCGSQRLTYRELNERANQLAHYLRRMDIVPDTPIGLFFNRSVDQVVGLLGILKAGAAYVPYDPAYPKDRLAAMFEDLPVKAVLTSERLTNRLPNAKIKRICLDGEAEKIQQESTETPDIQPAASHLCYVIFTSGSTGRAKAAAVYHGGWTNLLNWFDRRFDISPSDKTLVVSSICFDLTQRAMAMPLTSGGELHLVASDHYDPELILNTLSSEKITIMNCAPSTFYPLAEGQEAQNGFPRLSSLRWLMLGGEAISASRLRNWVAAKECKARIANVYGAAECSDVSSYYVLEDYDRYVQTSVPIGRHIYNTQIYMLDEHMQLVPTGIAGEICLAGDGVGKGYINDAPMTAKKFPANPFVSDPANRIYRTGDLARWLPDGNLEFLGRIDNQVKIRGQRVDLGEIETILRQHADVREAVVMQSQAVSDIQRLIAYVIPRQPERACEHSQMAEDLRAAVAARLPQYMVPNAFVILDEFPLSPNGKLDRGALPQPTMVRGGAVTDPPQTETEKTLAEMFARTLNAEAIGVNDNFFALGGHSLLVTQILANIGTAFNMEFPAVVFYKDPTVAAIASHIDVSKKNGPPIASS